MNTKEKLLLNPHANEQKLIGSAQLSLCYVLNEVVVPIHIRKGHLHKSERMTLSTMVEMGP